jgi:hypothetical protein
VRRSVVVVVAVALLAAGCGGASKHARVDRTFSEPQLPFTFRYPNGFRVSTPAQGSVLALVALDVRNALAIRRTSTRALDPDQYLGSLRADFARQGFRVAQRREEHAGQQMGVLSFTIPASNPASGGRSDLRTTNYFFTAGGRTWQLECRSADRRAAVDRACAGAVSSLHVS